MIILLLFVLTFSVTINASHFNGGTITWSPITPNDNSSSVNITITQTYSWSYPIITCTTNVPATSGRGDTNLTCIGNCSNDGGYSNAPVDILTDCISYSTSLGMMSSQRSVNTTLLVGAYFYLAYTGAAWRDLYDPAVSGIGWSIVTLIDLRIRPDGIINTPPVANVISPQYVIVNTTNLINIPVSDVNQNDDLRCRWAINNVNLSIDECSGICYPRGLPNGTTLSNCTLSFTGLVPSTWYAIAIQVEDFINVTSTEPMSSVPVQFLIYVQPTPTCTILPLILSLTDCLEVEVGITKNFTLYAMNLCDSTVTITDMIVSKGISGMTAGNLANSTTNKSLSYIPLTWQPQANQIGSQELCVIAYNNLFVGSIQYCVTFTVTSSTPNCPITTIARVSLTTTANKPTDGINIPLVVGLSLLALMLTLGCCCCCLLYHLLWSGAAKRRRQRQEIDGVRRKKYPQILPLILTRNLPFLSSNKNSLVPKVSNNRDSKYNLRLSTPTTLSYLPKNQIPLVNTENTENESRGSKLSLHQHNDTPRNKLSAAYDNQRKDRSNTITTCISINNDIIVEDANVSMNHGEPLNTIRPNGVDTPTIRRTQIKGKSSVTEKKQRSRSNAASIDSQPTVREHSSRVGSVSVTRVRKLSDTTQSKKSRKNSILPADNGEHTDNKVTVKPIPREKTKNKSHASKLRKSVVDVMN